MNLVLENITNQNVFLLSVFIGMITFSIPFLWNAYQIILDKKKHIIGEKIENILVKEFYQNSVKLFKYFIQYPIGIAIFLGLFIIPVVFSFELAIIFLIVIFIYFLFLPQIFHFIENQSSIDLKNFLLHKDAKSKDVLKVFKELWQKKDDEIEKEFSIQSVFIFESFSQKIDYLIKNNELILVKEYFDDFLALINNRSVFLLVGWKSSFFCKFLEWHFIIWKKNINTRNLYVLDLVLEKIEERSIEEGCSLYFFKSIESHIETYKEKFVKEKGKNLYYVDSIIYIFFMTLAENINKSSENYQIFHHYFPVNWKITIANKDIRIAHIILSEFLEWSMYRIFKQESGENFDKNLTRVISGIFPNVHSVLFKEFLILFFSGEIKSVLETKINFSIIHVSTVWSASAEESEESIDKRLFKAIKEEEITQKKETIQIILNFFNFWRILRFNQENLSEDELKNWNNFTEEQKQSITKKIKKEKLEKIKIEIESDEVEEICKNSEQKKLRRKNILELIELLLEEINK